MKAFFAALLLFSSFALATSPLNCSDLSAIAQEVVPLAMLGAGEKFMDPKCASQSQFKYFRPEAAEEDDSDGSDPRRIKWFDPKTDKYAIKSVRNIEDAEGARTRIEVEFVIQGRPLVTRYFYQANAYLAEQAGVCGIVYNDETEIYRSDCRSARAQKPQPRSSNAKP